MHGYNKEKNKHFFDIQVIKFWLDKCSWDFQVEKMVSLLNAFIDGPLSRDGNLSLVKQLRNSIGKLHRKVGNGLGMLGIRPLESAK